MNKIETKRPYQHFKGNLYYVFDIVKDVETMEDLVIYQALYPPYGMFSRKLEDFSSTIDVNRVDNILKQEYRFMLFDSSKNI